MLELGKILIHEFTYDYAKLKFGKKANLHYIYKYIAKDVETIFDKL